MSKRCRSDAAPLSKLRTGPRSPASPLQKGSLTGKCLRSWPQATPWGRLKAVLSQKRQSVTVAEPTLQRSAPISCANRRGHIANVVSRTRTIEPLIMWRRCPSPPHSPGTAFASQPSRTYRGLIAKVDFSFCHVVALDPRRSEALVAHLRDGGVRIEATSELIVPGQVPASTTALVWLTDGYPAIAVVTAVGRLRRRRPSLRIVLVTSWPDELGSLLARVAGRVASVILRSPAVAADVLSAVRPSVLTGPRS